MLINFVPPFLFCREELVNVLNSLGAETLLLAIILEIVHDHLTLLLVT